MTLCIVIITICGVLYCICMIAARAPEGKTLHDWLSGMAATLYENRELTPMKKVVIIVLVVLVMLTSTAMAVSIDEVEVDEVDVLGIEEAEEPVKYGEVDSESIWEEPVATDPPAPAGDDPGTLEGSSVPEVIPSLGDDEAPEDNVSPYEESYDEYDDLLQGLQQDGAGETPEPTEEPDSDIMTFEEEVLTVLGNIQGYLLFIVVVLLLYCSYKFMRMFF